MVKSDELWFWHSGGPLELRFGGDGEQPAETGVVVLGPTNPQVLIPAGVWQAAVPAAREPVLVSCVVSPGFDFADFRGWPDSRGLKRSVPDVRCGTSGSFAGLFPLHRTGPTRLSL